MKIDNVHIQLISPDKRDAKNSLRAFARFEILDDDFRFVVRDARIIQAGEKIIVAMPTRIVDFHCESCHTSNVWNARFCNCCGDELPERRLDLDQRDRPKKSYDVIFPADIDTRRLVNDAILDAYRKS